MTLDSHEPTTGCWALNGNTGSRNLPAVVRGGALTQILLADVQVLEETLHCIPDHVLDAPPRQLEAYQQPIAGLTDAELPASPWASAAVQSSPAAADEQPHHHMTEEDPTDLLGAVEGLQLARTRAVAVMA